MADRRRHWLGRNLYRMGGALMIRSAISQQSRDALRAERRRRYIRNNSLGPYAALRSQGDIDADRKSQASGFIAALIVAGCTFIAIMLLQAAGVYLSGALS